MVPSSTTRTHPRWVYAALTLGTMAFGLGLRFAPLGLPHAVTKYGGSGLWAIAIFWLVSLLTPRRAVASRAILALLIAITIECLKLVRTPALNRFRLTLAGKLLLGRFFSFRDLLAYALALTLAAFLDTLLHRRDGPHAAP